MWGQGEHLSGKADGIQDFMRESQVTPLHHAVLSTKVRYPNPAAAKLMIIVRGRNAFWMSVVEVQSDTGTHAAQQDEHG